MNKFTRKGNYYLLLLAILTFYHRFIQIGKDFPLIAVGLPNKVRVKGITANKHPVRRLS